MKNTDTCNENVIQSLFYVEKGLWVTLDMFIHLFL